MDERCTISAEAIWDELAYALADLLRPYGDDEAAFWGHVPGAFKVATGRPWAEATPEETDYVRYAWQILQPDIDPVDGSYISWR